MEKTGEEIVYIRPDFGVFEPLYTQKITNKSGGGRQIGENFFAVFRSGR